MAVAQRTVDLNDEICDELSRFAERRGQPENEVIEDALERYIAEVTADEDVITDPVERAAILEAAAGMWQDRTDLPDFRELRKGWGKRLERLFGNDDSSIDDPAAGEAIPPERQRPREFGSGAGMIVMSDDFNEPLYESKDDQLPQSDSPANGEPAREIQ
ncbi:MAG TPA: hypothetical protein VFS20_27805 [Longimicrobium sp.]|nr:hypothetical protein [Longimicrobium sp.]